MFTGNGIFNIIAKYENALESRVVGLNKRIQVWDEVYATTCDKVDRIIDCARKTFFPNKTDTVIVQQMNIVTALCCHLVDTFLKQSYT